MSFSTLFFVFTWLPCVMFAYYVLPKRFQNTLLLIASFIFYTWGDAKFIVLLLAMIVINYFAALVLANKEDTKRKAFFIEVIVFNVFILFYFKYYGFFLDSIFNVIQVQPSYQLFGMPLGISFFMFSLLSYVIDVYKGRCKAETSFFDFALYVSFFPKLIMGPIVRYAHLKEQMHNHPFSYQLFSIGAKRFIIGLAQKVILANTFASLFASLQVLPLSFAGSWLMTLAYALQLYFDFNGYTHMAIGLANMFGFKLVENFNYPYIAKSIKDFWGRWHISLSQWFRDYVYIPLGGNRVSKVKHIRNILVVWTLTGIWHGANYTFIVWGLYYGILLLLEKFVWGETLEKLPTFINRLITFVFVLIGWVFFYSSTIEQAFAILGSMFNLGVMSAVGVGFYFKTYFWYICMGVIGMTPAIRGGNIILNHYLNKFFYIIIMILTFIVFLLSIAFMISNSYQSFLYFSF